MSNILKVGPLLGFEHGDFYSVCVLIEAGAPPPVLELEGQTTHLFEKVAMIGTNEFWRSQFAGVSQAAGRHVKYTIKGNGVPFVDRYNREEWKFYIPSDGEEPCIAYGSCNGFSSFKLVRDTNQPYVLWERMAQIHFGRPAQNGKPEREPKPYSLLLMGGDQVYADEIWESKKCPALKKWSELDWDKQHKAKVSVAMAGEIERFYNELYVERWQNEHMSLMFATIPSVMMWDDHDIFDGWGSYPEERQNCPVFKQVFSEAARVFDVFQLRCGKRNRLKPNSAHRTLGLRFGEYYILILDNRSERTQSRVMSEENWKDTKQWLASLPKPSEETNSGVSNLLVLTGVPVVYRSFGAVEAVMDATFWHEELEDDVYDHWSARLHQGERNRLVSVLLEFLETQKDAVGKCQCKAVLLSGDVHVGALGQIWNERAELGITQIISTGIVHPPPTAFAWAGILLMTSDTPEALGDGEVVAEMLTPEGGSRYLRIRNFVSLQTGTDEKIRVDWVCENEKLKPSFRISLVTPRMPKR